MILRLAVPAVLIALITGAVYTDVRHGKIDNKLTLTGAQRIAAETTLGVAAGLPELEVGQNVTITKTALQQAVDAAKGLSMEQQALWAPYAADVTFE